MKTQTIKLTKRKPKTNRNSQHIVQDQATIIRDHIRNLQSQLRMHYGGLERIYAFACGEKNLQKSRYSKRAQTYQRTLDDEQRLQWTVENVQKQIAKLQQELFQLMRSL